MSFKAYCCDASPCPPDRISEHELVEEALYNIEYVDPPRWPGDEYGVRVTGNRTWWIKSGRESLWRASRFRRPNRKRDISIDLSKPKPEPVESGFDIYEQ